MRTGKRRMICLILSVILFLSGVYFEQFKTDSFLVHASMGSETTSIRSCQTVSNDANVCTVRMLRDGNCARLQQSARYSNPKREMRSSLNLLQINSSFLAEGNNPANSVLIQFSDHKPIALVTNYIHESDGKKRI